MADIKEQTLGAQEDNTLKSGEPQKDNDNAESKQQEKEAAPTSVSDSSNNSSSPNPPKQDESVEPLLEAPQTNASNSIPLEENTLIKSSVTKEDITAVVNECLQSFLEKFSTIQEIVPKLEEFNQTFNNTLSKISLLHDKVDKCVSTIEKGIAKFDNLNQELCDKIEQKNKNAENKLENIKSNLDASNSISAEIKNSSTQVKTSIDSLIPIKFIVIVLLVLLLVMLGITTSIALSKPQLDEAQVTALLSRIEQALVTKSQERPIHDSSASNTRVTVDVIGTQAVIKKKNTGSKRDESVQEVTINDKLITLKGSLLTIGGLPSDIKFAKKVKFLEKIEAELRAIDVDENPLNVAIYVARPSERIGEISNEHRANINTLTGKHDKVILLALRDADNCEILPKFELAPSIQGLHNLGYIMCYSDGSFNAKETLNKNNIAKIKGVMQNE